MSNDHSTKAISRLLFLRSSGLAAAGLSLLPLSAFAMAQDDDGHNTAAAGLAGYHIVIPANATEVEKEAAEQLRNYLETKAGGSLPVVAENSFKGSKAMYLGRTQFAVSKQIDVSKLQEDGFLYQPFNKQVLLVGGSGKGLLYGCYWLLEQLGYRMYTADVKKIPTNAAVTFPRVKKVDVPFIRYRTTSYRDTRDKEYTNWHRLSSRDNWGLFVHTFDTLVPPATYGKSNPEYFSLVNGNRQPGTQLCLSNAEVLAVVVDNLSKKIAGNKSPLYWSVSQNDNDQHCRCNNCTALNDKYGKVPSGSMLWFVNQVARRFPDKIISTLAYWYSRSAPKNIRAESNVNIMLCNIESHRQGPVYETDPAFTNDLKDWGRLTGNILIWDYNIQFSNLVSPFPNLHTIKPNIKFYTENNVNSLFMQSNSQVGGEFAGLRAYLICKLMSDPTADDNAIIDDFLDGYYGAAGKHIRQYIDSMRKSLLATGFRLSIFGDPVDAKDSYLSAGMIDLYNRLFDEGEQAVAKEPALLQRVRIARLPIMYAQIQIGRQEVDTQRSLYMHQPDGMVTVKPAMKKLLLQFVEGCKVEGVTRLKERSTPPDDFLKAYQRIFTNMEGLTKVLSYGKKITAITNPARTSKPVQALTDGLFGSWESWSNPDAHWVGYEGEHMDFILDLGEVQSLSAVNMDFLNAQAQPDWNLLVLPGFVTYATSVDGEKYGDAIKVLNPHHPNPKENATIASVAIHSFTADLKGIKARFIKVHAESMLKLPGWHLRAGKSAWIYCDEILVR